MIDYSFLRLKNNLKDALNVKDSPLAKIVYHNQIQLLPNETYLQITNIKEGIAFDNDYKCELICTNGNVLSNITSKVGVYEFTDKNGINQLAIELSNLSLDYGFTPICLKLSSSVYELSYFSNPFILTSESENETVRFDYKSYGYFQGISYDKLAFYQSIRVNFYFDNIESATETSEYYQISSENTISTRALFSQKEKYKCSFIDIFNTERLNILLIHDIIYIDGVRITNKPQIKNSERLEYSNLMEGNFDCFKNENDTYKSSLQIIQPFALFDKLPFGNYTLGSFPYSILGIFNRNISKNIGNVTIYNAVYDSVLATYSESDIAVSDNYFQIDLSGLAITQGNYYIKIDNGLFDADGLNYEGIDNNTEWTFKISFPDFLAADFNSSDFLTN